MKHAPAHPTAVGGPNRWRRRGVLAVAYVATIGAVMWGLFEMRRWTFSAYGTSEAHGQWQSWKRSVADENDQGGPAKRHAVTANEPPSLVLFRDYFPAICATVLPMASFLFAFMAFVVLGMLDQGKAK